MDLLLDFSFLVVSLITLIVLFVILRLYHTPFVKIVVGGAGLLAGLLISALLDIFISDLPLSWSRYLSFGSLLLFGFGGMYLFLANQKLLTRFSENLHNLFIAVMHYSQAEQDRTKIKEAKTVLDTSTVIDGRIEDILKTGFIKQKILIPQAVIEELHKLSDAAVDIKRGKGKRGLAILEKIQKISEVDAKVIKDDFPEITEVDQKLIKIAKQEKASIMTVDYNLNKVAKIQKINVLNVNELANALRMALLPGEEIKVKIVQKGKEKNQGVGYLPDGTMIVVDDSGDKKGDTVTAIVTKSFQTEAGRMIFAEQQHEKTK